MSEPLPRGDELIAEQQFSASMQDKLEAFRTHHLAEMSRLTRELLELRAELATTQSNPSIEAYRALCLEIDGIKSALAGARAELAQAKAATPEPVVPFQGVPHGKLTRLVAQWRREVYVDEDGIDAVRRCADQLSRILKP